MTRRRQIITAVTTGTLTQAQAARAYGVSPSMVSKLLRQWAREGTAAYYTKPSTPHGHPAATVPRQVVGRISLVLNVGVVGSARPRCTSLGRFHEMASWGRSSLYSIR